MAALIVEWTSFLPKDIITGKQSTVVETGDGQTGIITSKRDGYVFTPTGTDQEPSRHVAKPGRISPPEPFLLLTGNKAVIPQTVNQARAIDRNHPKGSLSNSRLNPINYKDSCQQII